MQRPLPPEILRVVELGRRGYSLREIAEQMGYSYSYLRKKLSLWRRKGYDIPRFKSGRKRGGKKDVVLFEQNVTPGKTVPKSQRRRMVTISGKGFQGGEKIFEGKKLLPGLKNSGERNEKLLRLRRDDLMKHIVSIVLSEGLVHSGEIKRRLRLWGFRFSESTFWRAVRALEIFGFVIVDRQRGPRGNALRPSPRLISVKYGVDGSRGGGNNFGGLGGVVAYVENRGRLERGFEFGGLVLGGVRWAQLYCRGGVTRFEFHPPRGRDVDFVLAVRDLLRVVSAVSVVVGLGWPDVVRMFAEEWARLAGG